MARGSMKKADFPKLVAAASENAAFVAPVDGPSGAEFAVIGPQDDVLFDFGNTKLPVKRHFFPQSEVLYQYANDEVRSAPLPEGKTILFGVRPCDVRSLLQLDKVFLDEAYVDPYYRERRENTLVISLACKDPAEPCFCTSVGCGPAAREGSDAIVFDLGDDLLFEAVSEKGEEFIRSQAETLSEPEAELVEKAEKAAAEAEAKLPKIEVEGIAEKLPGIFDSPVWQSIADRCLSCGICTFVCPTCHCFGIHDEKADEGGQRIRVQDGCMFLGFTVEASGHNPRILSGQRMRQRIMHKFRYTVENFSEIFCVGCGRCISSCPVNIDVRETIAEVMR